MWPYTVLQVLEQSLIPGEQAAKTHLAIALGREAILAGYSVQFTTAMALVAGLAKAHGEKRLDEKLLGFARTGGRETG